MALKDSFRALRRPRRIFALVLVVAAAAAGVAAALALRSGSGGPASHGAFLKPVTPPPADRATGPAVPRSLADLATRLPLERQVAQLFIFGFTGTGPGSSIFGDLAKLDIGGISITADNYKNPQQLSALTGLATRVANRHRLVPAWLLTVQDGGDFSELSDLPPADAPSDIKSIHQAAVEAAQAAASLRRLGINGVLGPDVDVDTSEGGAYTRLAYSDLPDEVARYAGVTVQAYAHQKMLTTPKHFPGLGASSQPTEDGQADVGLSLQQLARRDLVPFKTAFNAGSQGVMLGHGLYATDDFVTPASESTTLATTVLRQDLHFNGIAVTDDLESPAIVGSQSVPDAAVAAIKAGADMVWISGPRGDQTAAYLAVLHAARRGEIPAARIESAVLRILQAKRRLGLMAGP
jgi:beta-N-acetylhexosaminidase